MLYWAVLPAAIASARLAMVCPGCVVQFSVKARCEVTTRPPETSGRMHTNPATGYRTNVHAVLTRVTAPGTWTTPLSEIAPFIYAQRSLSRTQSQVAKAALARQACVVTPIRDKRHALDTRQAIFLCAAGALGGAINAVAGGGSFVAFPALLFTGVPAVPANATNALSLWVGVTASGGAYWKRLNISRRVMIPLILTSIIGGIAGAFLLIRPRRKRSSKCCPGCYLGRRYCSRSAGF